MTPCTDPAPGSGPPPASTSDSHDTPVAPPPPLIPTGHSSVPVLQPWSDQDGGRRLVQSPGFGLGSGPTPASFLASIPNPYPAPGPPPSCQVSVIAPSPERQPGWPRCSEESDRDRDPDPDPDLECSICFSHFNNVFRCPKMLRCRHTFCLECLARINVKSSEPSTIQCPLCRGHTPLPALGLTKLTTDPHVLSSLPAAMQRVYSIRFIRNQGRLQVKRRSAEGQRRWGQRSLEVGLPSPPAEGVQGEVGGALFRLTGRPVCRAFLLTTVVMMMVLLTGIIIFLLTYRREE